MSQARFTLRADISEFYRSIYTHSIEWALHTKAVAKANLRSRSTPRSIGAELDRRLRRGQENQTKGIPIGPDTSFLIGELILSAIDAELAARHPSVVKNGMRFMDDLEYFASSRSEAEEILMSWDGMLSGFDLSLNAMKTSITEGLTPIEATWVSRIRQFTIRRESDGALANDIRSLFSVAVELAATHPGDSVLSYAIRAVSPIPEGQESWPAFVDLVLAASSAEPSCLPYAWQALTEGRKKGAKTDYARVTETIESICRHHSQLEHGSEVAWGLSILIDLGLTLSRSTAEQIAGMQDNCALLLLMHLNSLNRIVDGRPDFSSVLTRAEDANAPWSADWLLGYEAGRHKWSSATSFRSQDHWRELYDEGVSFFTPKHANTRPRRPSSANRTQGSPLDPGAS